MAHPFLFGAQIEFVFLAGFDDDRNPFGDFEPISGNSDQLFRIVGQKTDGFHAEIEQNLHADAVFSQVGGEAELLVGFEPWSCSW